MSRRKAPAWSTQEVAVLRDVFPREGVNGAADALPDRNWQAINVMASKLGLRSPVVGQAPDAKLQGEQLEAAIRLREEQGWSFARIGASFGISESAACNAVLVALCPRKGFVPAERDRHGRLTPAGLERLRAALRKGAKATEIQLRLGLSASRIAEERRRYARDLKERGKAPLPRAGADLEYSGRKLTLADRREVERLFMEGLGAKKITERTRVSNTHVGRIRNRLISRLKRKGECLPGCDVDGVRRKQAESTRFIPPASVEALRQRLLEREPVTRAARDLGIGTCSAFRIRDRLAAELAVEGRVLPPPIRLGKSPEAGRAARKATWLPPGKLFRYRALCHEFGPEAAKQAVLREAADEARAQAARKLTFEEQLARVRAGAPVAAKLNLRRSAPAFTLGGVATGALG